MDKQFAFERGWYNVTQRDAATVRKKLMSALEITTRAHFLRRMHGDFIPKRIEKEAIEKIFNDFGITEVWGEV